ncbi:MAG: L,D-transpeptidase family protein [Crocinitomicaceae bacterium]|nr:L,D-transpeptidase family protein [Crocinitomicaceae bacterium]
MKRYLLYNILSLVTLVSIQACSVNSRELSEEEMVISEELKSKFENTDLLVFDQDTLLASKEVLSYYKAIDYEPIWITKKELNSSGREMLDLIENSRDYGLHPEMFRYSLINKMKDTSILDAELMLTNAFFLFTTHVDVGCIDPISYLYVWKKDSLDFDLNAELDKVREGTSVKKVATAHQPDFWEYRQLQSGLAKFLDEYPLDTFQFDIPAFKDDSVKCYAAAHEALLGHQFIDSTISKKDSAFLVQLKVFQKMNGLAQDGIVGKWTGRALNKSNLDRYLQAALALEKWRWKEKFPDKYIRVNIPEFTLYFVDSNKVKNKHRVVVGAYLTQTPEFQATMRRMVTNPFWHVPYSIASTEILVGAKKDSNYFAKRGYKVFQDGNQVDPSSINWTTIGAGSFNYKIRQDGGGGNSLGRIKFLFPNHHSVFIHDTPSKSLFYNDVRAYSHGCVRLHQPFDLAKAILVSENHKVPGDSLDAYVRRGLQRVIELDDPFEVYLEYFTATGDSSGNVIFHPDIYNRDEKYIEYSFKRFEQYGPAFFKVKPPVRKEETEVADHP